ncbi:MAG TPA: CinA family protein [Mycobacteriales bacterium]|nr:CinA family protein [Mycobacteriales bacterium]
MPDVPAEVADVHRLLAAREATVAAAESLTGGLLAAALTTLPGSSARFRGGIVAYATDLKASLLDVAPTLLAAHGPVHPSVAVAMAEGVRRRCVATYGVSLTGVAGPDPQAGRSVGTVHAAVVGPDEPAVRSVHLPGPRETVRGEAVLVALRLLRAGLAREPLL